MDSNVRRLEKKYCSQVMLIAIFVAVIFIIIGHKPVGKGFLLASIFSVVNFALMARLNPLILGRSSSKAGFVALGSISLRYVILAIPLIFALKNDSIDFVATVVGLFSVQIVILLDHLVLRRFSIAGKV